MAQLIQNILMKYGHSTEALVRGELSLTQLRTIVRAEGQTFEVFKAMSRMRG